jgi:hypothetical protein
VAIALVAAGLVAAGDSGSSSPGAGLPSKDHVRKIERDVERLRGHRFKRPIEPKLVSPEQAKQDSLRDVNRDYPPRQRRADEELLKLLALIPRDADIVKLLGAISSEQVIGYYDTRRKTLRIVSGNGADSPALVDITLAHELTHALEDQVFGLKEPTGATDDSSSASTALSEGTATYVMDKYTQCCVDAGSLALGSLGSLFQQSGTDLPPYIERTLLFSYTGGEEFVRQLHDATGNWSLVDAAISSRPPVSTEQIIHPDKYVPFERPLDVRLRVAPVLGPGWKRASAGEMGELDTRELLRLGDQAAAPHAAAGWGGGRYELWQRPAPAGGDCAAPCRPRDALVLSWRWDTPRDAREFLPVLREYVAKGLHGRPAGRDVWGLGGDAVAIGTGPSATTIAWAPDARVARTLATRAPVRAP